MIVLVCLLGALIIAGCILLGLIAERRQKLWGLWLYYCQELHGAVHGGLVETCPKAICCNFVRVLERTVGGKAVDAVRRSVPRGWYLRKTRRQKKLERDAAEIGRSLFEAQPIIRPMPTRAVGAASGERPRPQMDIERALTDQAYYEEHRPYFLGFCQKVGIAERARASRQTTT